MATLKVMTWNIENLFRPGDRPEVPDTPNNQENYQQKLASLSSTILTLNPDVLALQEVGSSAALGDLLALLEGRYPHSQLSTHPDPRGIRVGFLSKLPIEDSKNIITFPKAGLPKVPGTDSEGNLKDVESLGRGALHILVKPKENFFLHLITAHLKSKLLTFPTVSGAPRFNPINENERARVAGIALLRRTAEAVALRVKANKILEGNSQQALILLGDMNDVTDAATTQILQGPGGSEIGTGGFDKPDKGDDSRLFNLAPRIPDERRYSRIYRGNKELIDHILVSQELLPGQPRKLPIVDSHVAATPIPSITDNPEERQGKPGSDHAPVTATFEL
jgi:endonuclease/exonuclease/phosphatase family metal-dependent hydrolase